jgi:hypothetical protein
MRGGLAGYGTAAGLAAACAVLALWRRGRPVVRAGLALSLVLLGIGLSYRFLRPNKPEAAPTPDIPRMGSKGVLRFPVSPNMPRVLTPDLVPLHSVGELLAAAVDTEVGAGFLLRPGGGLEQYSYPDFTPHGKYRLEQPGYRAVLDGRRGRLYVAASEAAALQVSRYGDRPVGRGDLHVYDVRALLDGTASESRLHPAAVIPLGGNVSHLLSAPGGEAVYFLLHEPGGDRVGRVAAGAETAVYHGRAEGLTALAVAPEGGSVYAAGPGAIVQLDATTLAVRQTWPTGVSVCDLCADRNGRLYLAEQGGHPLVSVWDARNGSPVAQWLSPLSGRNYLAVTPDGVRLYLCTSALVGSSLHSIKVAGDLVVEPKPWATAAGDWTVPVRGEFFLTADARCILTRWGHVYRLAPTEPRRG